MIENTTMEFGTRSPAIAITKDKTLLKNNKIVNQINPTKIGTWNVRTLLKSVIFDELKQQMEFKKLDILEVRESRWGDNGDFWSDDFITIQSRNK